jgi:hypothetical protein
MSFAFSIHTLKIELKSWLKIFYWTHEIYTPGFVSPPLLEITGTMIRRGFP